jgi:hypothetical protein
LTASHGSDSPLPVSPDGGFLKAANRVSVWTTRLLLSGVVLVIGLGFGRQVLEWWAPASAQPESVSMAPDSLADAMHPHRIAFGDGALSIERRTMAGTREEAVAALGKQCGEATRNAPMPAAEPNASERSLLERLSPATAQQVVENRQVHVVDRGVPMAVGLKYPPNHRPAEGSNLAQSGARVVTWMIAIPSEEDAWTLYSFQPEQTSNAAGASPVVPLPPGARRTMALEAIGGGAMIGFEGDVEPAACLRFYEQWFAGEGWSQVGGWHRGDGWYARFRKETEAAVQTADVRCGVDHQNRLSGMLIVTSDR